MKHALIEAVSAFELAINEFFKRKITDVKYESLFDNMASFVNLPLRAQVFTIGILLGNIPLQDIENAVNVIDKRNKLIHEGRDPPEKAKYEICSLLNITKKLLSGPGFKFPKSNPGNLIMSNEDWERE